jgi:hypothetical protein
MIKRITYIVFILSCISCSTLKTHKTVNPIKNALGFVAQSAIFKIDGFYLWDPSIIKVGDTYHLFCSRWPEDTGMNGWKKSEIIRSESNSLFGPYEFKAVVLQPSQHPWATQGVHNPKITKIGDIFLLYHLGIPKWQTGFSTSKSIAGPFEPFNHPVFNTGNASLIVREDGSVYAVGKRKIKNEVEGTPDYLMEGFVATDYEAPFKSLVDTVGDRLNLLPNQYQLEDPTLWFANHKYHVICNDWKAKATGVEKALVYYTSTDGKDYRLVSQHPIWTHQEGIPLENWTNLQLNRLERPQVFLNDNNEVIALMAAALPADGNPSFIVIRPVQKYDSK